jgi:SPX domain protein involved in polyphosphate accumulation
MASLSHAVRRFNRFELKYLVPIRAAERFKRALSAHLVPDEHGDSLGRYDVSSLYYDGPDFCFYWEKVEGIKFRRKLRIRHYGSGEPLGVDTPVFVEIKQRLNRVTQKRRVLLPYCEALRLCNERAMPERGLSDPKSQEAAILDEVMGMLWQYDLCPASIVRYARQALIGTDYDVGLRVTFDTDLSYQVNPLELEGEPNGLLLFPPDWAVVEIKVNERIPYWLTELVAVHNLSLVRVSKYCRSIELAEDLLMTASRQAWPENTSHRSASWTTDESRILEAL